MQRGKKRAAVWPLIVTPALIFAVGVFADFVLSAFVQGLPAESILSAVSGVTVGALTVLTFARRRDAYIVAAGLYSAVAIIAATLTISLPLRLALVVACLVAVTAALLASIVAPEPQAVNVRNDRPRR